MSICIETIDNIGHKAIFLHFLAGVDRSQNQQQHTLFDYHKFMYQNNKSNKKDC